MYKRGTKNCFDVDMLSVQVNEYDIIELRLNKYSKYSIKQLEIFQVYYRNKVLEYEQKKEYLKSLSTNGIIVTSTLLAGLYAFMQLQQSVDVLSAIDFFIKFFPIFFICILCLGIILTIRVILDPEISYLKQESDIIYVALKMKKIDCNKQVNTKTPERQGC